MGADDTFAAINRRPFGVPSPVARNSFARSFRGFGAGTNIGGSGASGFSFTAAPKPKAPPVAIPEAFRFSAPFSTDEPGVKIKPLQLATTNAGDILGSLQEAWQDVERGGFDLATAIPNAYQGLASLVHSAAQSDPGNPLLGVGDVGLDIAMKGINWFSDTVGPLMSDPVKALTKSATDSRATVYRNLVAGNADPYAGLGIIDNAVIGTAAMIGDLLGMSDDEEYAFAGHLLDLPGPLKDALRANPNMSDEEYNDLMAEVGYRWSYDDGFYGGFANIAGEIGAYGTELVVASRLPGFGAGLARGFAPQAAAAVGAQLTRLGVSKLPSIAQRINSTFFKAGLGAYGYTVALNVIARVQGNQAALDFSNVALNYHPISENPNVQLVTSFTINPLAAVGQLRRGIIRLGHGADVLLGVPGGVASDIRAARRVGGELADIYARRGTLERMISITHGVSMEGAPKYMDDYLGGRGGGMNRMWEMAAQEVIERLPAADRNILQSSFADGVERTTAVIQRHTAETVDILTNHLDLLKTQVQEKWRIERGLFRYNPEIAGRITQYYQAGKLITYDARQATDAVLGYPERLMPEQLRDIVQRLDDAFPAAGDRVPTDWLDAVNANYPGLANYHRRLFPLVKDHTVTRAQVDDILGLAQRETNELMQSNPVLVKTGADPLLTPTSNNQTWADAFGTDVDTVVSLRSIVVDVNAGKPLPPARVTAVAPLARSFLMGKRDAIGRTAEQVTAMTDEQVVMRAAAFVNKMSEPWLAKGKAAAEAEETLTGLRKQAAEAKAIGDSYEAKRLLGEATRLERIIRTATGPLTPFSSLVRRAEKESPTPSATLRADAMRKVDAMRRLQLFDASHDEVRILTNYAEPSTILGWIKKAPEGNWTFSGGAPSMTAALRKNLADFLRHTEDARISVSEAGDGVLWSLVNKYANPFLRINAAGRKLQGVRQTQRDTAARARPIPLDALIGMRSNLSEGQLWDELLLAKAMEQEALAGGTWAQLENAAAANVPGPYVAAAEAIYQHDYRMEADGIGQTIETIRAALTGADNPVAYSMVDDLVSKSPMIADDLAEAARAANIPFREFITDPKYAGQLAEALPNVERVVTPLDEELIEAIAAGGPIDAAMLKALGEDVPERLMTPHPIKDVSLDAMRDIAAGRRRVPGGRAQKVPDPISVDFGKKLARAQADLTELPDRDLLAKNAVGREVLSIVGYGTPGRLPSRLEDVLVILKEIENGNAANLGFGAATLAEAQRLGVALLNKGVGQAERASIGAGFIGRGVSLGNEFPLFKELFAEGKMAYSENGGVVYAIKKGPKDMVGREFEEMQRRADEAGIAGLAEEMFTKYFRPFEERLATAQIRQGLNVVFGGSPGFVKAPVRLAGAVAGRLNPRAVDADVGVAQTYARWLQRTAALGVDPGVATAVWKRLQETAHDSVFRYKSRRTPEGKVFAEPTDSRLFATAINIPNGNIIHHAQKAVEELKLVPEFKGKIGDEYDYVPWDQVFRESTSDVLRALKDSPLPMGDKLAAMYGVVSNNWFVRTGYYLFRFALDVRFIAQNAVEGMALYAGRAVLVPGSLKKGMFGVDENFVSRITNDSRLDSGWGFSKRTNYWAYKTVLKEQPRVLKDAMGRILHANPELAERAYLELATNDPMLRDIITTLGDTPEGWLAAQNAWHKKIMEAADVDGVVDDEIALAISQEPAMAELYSHVGKAVKDHLTDVRATFFGNPNRSQVERTLNHFLLYWPLSYVIKSTKWLTRVLYDRAGGLQTNGFGAYSLNNMIAVHNQQLAESPEYRQWFIDHEALVFTAQMLLPTTWASMGVSLSPILRNVFFPRSKQVLEVGPVYSINEWLPSIVGELHSDLGHVPFLGNITGLAYSSLGQNRPLRKQRLAAVPGETQPLNLFAAQGR